MTIPQESSVRRKRRRMGRPQHKMNVLHIEMSSYLTTSEEYPYLVDFDICARLLRWRAPRHEDDTPTIWPVEHRTKNLAGERLPAFLSVRIRFVCTDSQAGVEPQDALTSEWSKVSSSKKLASAMEGMQKADRQYPVGGMLNPGTSFFICL